MASPTVSFESSPSEKDALDRACGLWGIQQEYWDIWGHQHIATPEVQRSILQSMGVPAGGREELDHAVEERLWNEWARLIPGTIVCGDDRTVALSVPSQFASAEVLLRIFLEDGTRRELRVPLEGLRETGEAELRGQRFFRKELQLLPELPHGYHTVEASIEGEAVRSRLIVCPERTWTPKLLENGGRTAGLAASLYGLRSERNWGCGDFTDLRALIDWNADCVGCSFLALNPLHAIPNRQPYNTSPYLPNCIFYRNPLYLDVEAIDDVRKTPRILDLIHSRRVQSQIEALRSSEFVEYELVYKFKLRFLRLGFRAFLKECARDSPRARELRAYVEQEGPLLRTYAIYCALDEWLHARHPDLWIWPDWPAEFRDPQSPAVLEFAEKYPLRILFYQYLQWQLDTQLSHAQRHARERGLEIGLYHDLALATDRCGSDLWAHRPYYVPGCRVGSPPDGFSPKGQDWGFPPPHSDQHLASGYELFAESIRKNCKHGGALRIDHVMRFFRLYWIPDSTDAAHGTYVREHWQDLLHILALESVRNRVLVVGEDLGTVEPSFREALARFGIFSYRLLYFEKNGKSFKLPYEYPVQALVSSTTHDLPTLAGFWQNRDIEARREAGLFPDGDTYSDELAARVEEKQSLLDALFHLGLLPACFPKSAAVVPMLTGELHSAIIGFLSMTPSQLLVINQEDLTKETEQQNLPGTTAEYPNWRRKMRFTLGELRTAPLARSYAEMLKDSLKRTGRIG